MSDNYVDDADTTGTPDLVGTCKCGQVGELIPCSCGEANCFDCWSDYRCNNDQCDRLSAVYDRRDD